MPHTNNGAESYHSHLNAEFYAKHPNIYMFFDVLKKIQQSAYVSMNSLSQRARTSKFELTLLTYLDYRRQVLIQERSFSRKYAIVMDQELICEIIHSSSF